MSVPQTFCAADVYLQAACSGSWNEITGRGVAISKTGGERGVASENLFGQISPVQAPAKHDGYVVTCVVAYTEAAGEAVDILRGVWGDGETCDVGLCLRWIPLGTTAGNRRFTTISGFLLTAPIAVGTGKADEIMKIEFKVGCPNILEDDVP